MKKKCIILIYLIIFCANCFLPKILYAESQKKIKDEQVKIERKDIFEDIKAPNLILVETDTGKVLYERNADKQIYPASITKLMTAIIVMENCELDEIVTVSENAVKSVPPGYVNANLQVGEELTVKDLMYVMLIPSANDAANALAEHIGGSIESFSTMMNTKAKELGCTGSNFTNPSGLQEKTHYTTTRDLYFIAKEAAKNSFIRKVIGTTNYTLPSTNRYTGKARTFNTTNYMKKKELSKYYCDYCIGGKTGYTGEAKNCVVEFAEKDDTKLTAVVMGERGTVKGQKFLDAKIMFEYIFKSYDNKKIAAKEQEYEMLTIGNGTKETNNLKILYKENVNILMEKGNSKEIKTNVNYYNLKAPIYKGEVLGKISFEYEGINYETDLIAGSDVQESTVLANILKLLVVALIIYIIYNLGKSKKKRRKNYKKHGKNIKC